jgi:hypothetical protein
LPAGSYTLAGCKSGNSDFRVGDPPMTGTFNRVEEVKR